MNRVDVLARKIEELRADLYSVMEEDRILVDPKVVTASQSLDKALIRYYRGSAMEGAE
jgi:hypothetical protein